ncbi:SigE family RNA polymerase sigma factor [soil metagenome]
METGDQRSFENAFAELFAAGYRSAFRVLGDAAAAEDAASEAVSRAALRWRRVRSHAMPWVVRVSTKLAIDQARKRSRVGPTPLFDDRSESDATPDEFGVSAALAKLPRRQREVIVLRYFGELSEREIATELGMAPGTVKSHASRGLDSLRHQLGVNRPSSIVAREGC